MPLAVVSGREIELEVSDGDRGEEGNISKMFDL